MRLILLVRLEWSWFGCEGGEGGACVICSELPSPSTGLLFPCVCSLLTET